jgi:hypothetical protein
MFERRVNAGDYIIRQGDDGDNFYVVDRFVVVVVDAVDVNVVAVVDVNIVIAAAVVVVVTRDAVSVDQSSCTGKIVSNISEFFA